MSLCGWVGGADQKVLGCHGPHMGWEWWVQKSGATLANHSAWTRPYAWQRFWRETRAFGPHREGSPSLSINDAREIDWIAFQAMHE